MRRISLSSRVAALALIACGLAVAAVARGAEGSPADQGLQQIPGFSAVPRVPDAPSFGMSGPNFAPSSPDADNARAPRAAAKSAANSPAAQDELDPDAARSRLLDTLFQRLKKSSDNDEAEGVAGAIKRVWFNSGSDTADLLMGRALLAEHAKHFEVGRRILGQIVQIEPDWAEAWNELAVARAVSDDSDGAMVDLAHALALEPRHFDALTGLGALLLRSGDKKGALKVFRRVVELYPRFDAVRSIVDSLTIQVEGRDL